MNKQEIQINTIITVLAPGAAVRRLAHRENRSFGHGIIAGVLMATFVAVIVGLGIAAATAPDLPSPLPVEQQLNDTLQMTHNLSSDSSYLDYRQGSPEGDRRFDSSTRADTEKVSTHDPQELFREAILSADSGYSMGGWLNGDYVLYDMAAHKTIARRYKGEKWQVLDRAAFLKATQMLLKNWKDSL